MTLFFLSFGLQLVFAIVRTANIAYIAKNHLLGSVLTGTLNSFLWIVTTKYGIDAYNDGVVATSGYIIGAVLGVIISMRHKQIINRFF